MRRILPWVLLLVSLSANLAVGAVAVHRRGAAPRGEARLVSRLQIDSHQTAQIARLRSSLWASRQEHGRAMADLRRQLARAITRQPEDPGAVSVILRDIGEAQTGYQWDIIDHVLSVRDVLRPDQRPAFEEMMSEHLVAGGAAACGDGSWSRDGGDRR